MTALILGILSSQAALMTTLIASQTPAEQLVMWTRFNTITEPLYLLLVKVEGLTAAPAASAASAAAPPPQ